MTLHPQVSASALGYWIVWMRHNASDPSASDIYGNFIPMGSDQAAGAEYAVELIHSVSGGSIDRLPLVGHLFRG